LRGRFVFAFFAVFASLAIAACGGHRSGSDAGGTLAEIKARGEIMWGGDKLGGAPYVSEDRNDPTKVVGFEVDIMDAIAKRLGVRQRFVPKDWPELVPLLERGDFDVVMNGLEATEERDERLRLSKPYYVYAETLTVRKDAPYKSLDDLAKKTVGTLQGTYAFEILRDRKIDFAGYDEEDKAYSKLRDGTIEAVLLDDVIANRKACSDPELRCLPGEIARGTYVIGMRKGDDELARAIDDALDDMRRSGQLEQILRKYNLWNARQTEPPPPIAHSANASRSFDLTQLKLFVSAAWVTLALSAVAFLLAVPIGLILAIARVYGGPIARALSRFYIEIFRGTPVLLQLYVIYYGMAPYWRLGPLEACVLGLGLNYGAYEAEVYRGALLAIPRGQSEAAKALGLGPWQSLRFILLPQALRLALPAMTNDFVSLLKDSSLVSTIAVIELTKRMQIAGVDLRDYLVPGLVCAAMYMILSFPLAELARRLERRLAHDQRPLAL